MKIRGQRECRECGTRWSYYETGAIGCPDCDSLRSRGVDERTEHTSAPVTLDLAPARSMVESEGLSAALDDAVDRCREFIRQTGFIHAGELEPLSETFLAANELSYAAREANRAMRIGDDEELYLLTLLRGADDDRRPDSTAVPRSMRAARGLAYAAAIDAYQRDLRTFLETHPDQTAQSVFSTIEEHVRRIEALDGEVDPKTAERLVVATHETSEYIRTGAETQLVTAQDRLDEIV